MPDRISWFIDNRPVRFGDWSADMVAHGGFRDFSGTAVGAALFAEQESEVAGYRRDGSPFWFGTMTLDPEITEAGAQISAEGLFKGKFATQSGRRFFMTRDEKAFKDMEAKPYEYNAQDAFDWSVQPGVMKWVGKKGENVALNDRAGAVFWAEGAVLTNLKATITGSNLGAQTDYRIETAFGPSGALTQEGASINSNAGTIDRALVNTSGDLVLLTIFRDTNPGAFGSTIRGQVKDIEVRGLATDSVFTVGDCYGVILQLDERAVEVAPSSLDVMPMDWNGTDFDLGMYLSAIGDWWFLILNRDTSGTVAKAGPWESEIQIARKRNSRTQLTPLRRYNRVRVPWVTTTEDERFSVGVAEPDPFPDQIVEFLTEALEDKQASASTIPQDIADTLVARYSKIRRAGTIDVTEAYLEGKRLSPYEIQAGVLADITDHDPEIPSQRIEAVAWDSSGVAHLSIESEQGAIRTLKGATGGKPPKKTTRKDH